MRLRVAFLFLAAFVAIGCKASGTPTVEELTLEVVERQPHDAGAFTQGLQLAGGRMYESTGLYGESTLREVEPTSGNVLRSVDLDDEYFGEGIAVVDDRLIQLTWQEHTALVYQLSDFSQVGTFAYDTEGWGLCDDGTRLVMSDGTDRLNFRSRTTFELLGSVEVKGPIEPLTGINELECVDGHVYANVHRTDTIVQIDPSTGLVTADIDASAVVSDEEVAGTGVLNGIAYDEATQTFLITGKNWPALFEVRFVRR